MFNSIGPEILFFLKLLLLLTVFILLSIWILNKWIGIKRTKNILISSFILSISFFSALLVSELIVRVIYSDITTTADSYGYFTSKWINQLSSNINSFGFREREISLNPEPGVYRVAIVGDSLTYGQGISEEDRLSNILERQMNDKNNKTFEILNFGRSGAETIDHNEFLIKYVLKINPDFILLQWYVNDFEGHDKSTRPFGQYWRLIPSDMVSGYLAKNSALFYLANKQWKIMQKHLGIGPTDSYTDYLVKRFKDPTSKDSIDGINELQKFIDLCKHNGIPVGMIVYPDLVENILEGYPLGFMLDRVLSFCAKNNIKCLDMRPVMASVKPYTRLWVNKFDKHPNKLANTLAAEEVMKTFSSAWKKNNNITLQK